MIDEYNDSTREWIFSYFLFDFLYAFRYKKTSPAAVKVGNNKEPDTYIRQRVAKANQIITGNAS